MNGFEFNNSAPFKKVFKAKCHIKPGSRRGQVILHFPAFTPVDDLNAPENATNFKLGARLIVLSDFNYDHANDSYEPINRDYHGKCASFDSGMLPMLKMPLDPITQQLCVNQESLPEGTSLFLLMWVSFYHYEDGNFQHLSKESSMQIQQVF